MSPHVKARTVWLLLGVVCLVAIWSSATTVAAQSEADAELIEKYLVERGMTRLLASYLEQRIADAVPSQRSAIADRLAAVYAELVERATSDTERRELERKTQELLTQVPEADTLELRLSLARASYLRAERIAEMWRLRMVSEEEAHEAARSFEEIERTLSSVAERAHDTVTQLERQEEAARSHDLELLSSALMRSRRNRSLAHYFAGWSLLYLSEIQPNRAAEAVVKAQRHFGWLLNARSGMPATPERAPIQLMRFDHVARSVIGMAMTESIRGNREAAEAWFALLDAAEDLPPLVTSQVVTYRFIALAKLGEWSLLSARIDQLRRAEASSDGAIPPRLTPLDARLLAVAALEADHRRTPASPVTHVYQAAISDLVLLGEHGHLVDLASQYDLESGARPGFVGHFIRGLRAYDRARSMYRASPSNDETPTADPAIQSQFIAASDQFHEAMRSSDAEGFAPALGSAQLLYGLSRYYAARGSGDLIAAAESLSIAASLLLDVGDARSADAHWMSIRSLDAAIDRLPPSVEQGRVIGVRNDRIDAFIEAIPRDERALILLVQRASEDGRDKDRAISELLSIPRDTGVYEIARRQAARLLYDSFKEISVHRRGWVAARYIDVAGSLLAIDRQRASSGDAEAGQRALLRARRIVEVALSSANPDVDRAEQALDAIASLIAMGVDDAEAFEDELHYRQVQIKLARGKHEEAEQLADQLLARNAKLGTAALQLVYVETVNRWRSLLQGDADPDTSGSTAQRIVRIGRAILRSDGMYHASHDEAQVLTLYATTAEAATDLWMTTHDPEARHLASLLLERVLRARPNESRALHAMARLSESIDDHQTAARCWRQISAGQSPGTDEWFASRAALIRALARFDPTRARDVLAQHKVLYPNLAPEPWGSDLRELDRRLEAGISRE